MSDRDSVSTYTLEGVSTLTVSQGDITLTCEVENFTVEALDLYEKAYDKYMYTKLMKMDTEYAIRSARIVPNEEGHYLVVRKDLKKPVVRTARIEVDRWDFAQIVAAREAVHAPDDAIPRQVRDGGVTYVEFEWEEK